MADTPKRKIIIDNGTGYIKAGLGGDEQPKVFPTCVDNKYPIKRGEIVDFDTMEKIWSQIFDKELKVTPEEFDVMLTKSPLDPGCIREKTAEIMFETFKVGRFHLAFQPVLSLYSTGKTTGLSVDLGEGLNSFVSISDGFPYKLSCFDFSGKDLTDYMVLLLNKLGKKFSTPAEREIAKDIKEKACYVALDFKEEINGVEPFDYKLPDGSHITLKEERIRCSESLFNIPIELDRKGKGIDMLCIDSLNMCNAEVRKDMYNYIVLSGGSSMCRALPERLRKGLKELAPEPMKGEIHVEALPNREISVWLGGSILSNVSSFEAKWVTKAEYEESGVEIVNKKCF